jgi:hypothetical protein
MTLSNVLKTLYLCSSLRDRKVKLYDTHLHVKDYDPNEDLNLLTKVVISFEYELCHNYVEIIIETDFSKTSKNFKSIAYS